MQRIPRQMPDFIQNLSLNIPYVNKLLEFIIPIHSMSGITDFSPLLHAWLK
ncbi:hypothetical protein ACI0FR_02513 [Paenochrobactrum sp. BZR 201-1]